MRDKNDFSFERILKTLLKPTDYRKEAFFTFIEIVNNGAIGRFFGKNALNGLNIAVIIRYGEFAIFCDIATESYRLFA